MDKTRFSIAHTTARPGAWRACYDAWWESAKNPDDLDYVLCVDTRWGFDRQQPLGDTASIPPARLDRTYVVYNQGPKSSVSGWNTAAQACCGEVLILNADDFRPPHHWDESLAQVINGQWDTDFTIEVSSSKRASQDKPRLMVLGIMSRVRYQRLGYVLHPDYESMYSDNDFTEHAWHDASQGISSVLDGSALLFSHEHPTESAVAWDEVYQHQNRAQAYQEGASLLARRRQRGFPVLTAAQRLARR